MVFAGCDLSTRQDGSPGVRGLFPAALQLLCSKLGINATVIVSESGNHMWNNVKYGLYWTGIDVTWNDTGSDRTEYFCTTVNNMDGHVVDDVDFVDRMQYPSLIAFSANDTLPQYKTGVTKEKILPYYDVYAGFWGTSQIHNVYNKGYMAGMTCVNFGIHGKVTRAQFAQILYNIAGRPAVTYTGQFSDVPQNSGIQQPSLGRQRPVWSADIRAANSDRMTPSSAKISP